MSFAISGEAPTAAERSRINGIFQEHFPWYQPQAAPTASKRPGVVGMAWEGVKQGAQELAHVPRALRAATGDTSAVEEIGKEKPPEFQPMGLHEVHGLGDAARFVAEQASYGLGSMAAPAAAGATLGLPFGPVGAGVGALAGMFLSGAAGGTEGNVKRQLERGTAPADVSGGTAGAVGAAQGAIGLIGPGRLGKPFLGKALTDVGETALKGVAEQAPRRAIGAGAAKEGVLMGGIGAGTGAASEAMTRAQAGQSVTDPEALAAMGEAGVTAAAGMAPLGVAAGAVGGARGRTAAQTELARRGAERDKAKADVEAAKTAAEKTAAEARLAAAEIALAEYGPEIVSRPPDGRAGRPGLGAWDAGARQMYPEDVGGLRSGAGEAVDLRSLPAHPEAVDLRGTEPPPGPPPSANWPDPREQAPAPPSAPPPPPRPSGDWPDPRQPAPHPGLPNVPERATADYMPPGDPYRAPGPPLDFPRPGTPTPDAPRAGAFGDSLEARAAAERFSAAPNAIKTPEQVALERTMAEERRRQEERAKFEAEMAKIEEEAAAPPASVAPEPVAARKAATAPERRAATAAERKAAAEASRAAPAALVEGVPPVAPIVAAAAPGLVPATPIPTKRAATAAERGAAAKVAKVADAAPAAEPVRSGKVVPGVRSEDAAVTRSLLANNPAYKGIISAINRIENMVRVGELSAERGAELLSDVHNKTDLATARELVSDAIARLPKKVPREPVVGPPASAKSAEGALSKPRDPPNGPLNPAKASWIKDVLEAAKGAWDRDPALRARMSEGDFARSILSLTDTVEVGYDPRAVVQMATDPQLVANARRKIAENATKKDQSEKLFSRLQEAATKKKTKADLKEEFADPTGEIPEGVHPLVSAVYDATLGFSKMVSNADIEAAIRPVLEGIKNPEARRIALETAQDLWGSSKRSVSRASPGLRLGVEYTPSHFWNTLSRAVYSTEADSKLMQAIQRNLNGLKVRILSAREYVRSEGGWQSLDGLPIEIPQSSGRYSLNEHAIYILDNSSPETISEVFFHELSHAVTAGKLELDPAFRRRADGLLDYVRSHFPGYVDLYGLSNSHEMLSEAIANNDFRMVLNEIKIDADTRSRLGLPAWVTDAWKALVSSIREAMGLVPSRKIDNALNAALHLAAEASEQSPAARREFQKQLRTIEQLSERPEDRAWNSLGVYQPMAIPGGNLPHVSHGLREGLGDTGRMPIGDRIQKPTAAQVRDAEHRRSTHELQDLFKRVFKRVPGVTDAGASKASFFLARNFVDKNAALSLMVEKVLQKGNDLTAAVDPHWFAADKDSQVARLNEEISAKVGDIGRYITESGIVRNHPKVDSEGAVGRNQKRNMESVEGYVMAQSALERNEYGRKHDASEGIPAAEHKPWSGMDDAEANRIIAAMQAKPDFAKYAKAAEMYFDLAKNITRVREEAGLIPKGVQGFGDKYVPMWDREWKDMDEGAGAGYNAGATMRPAAREDRRASGRVGVSQDDLLKNITEANWRAHRNAANNKVAQRLYEMVSEHGPEAGIGRVYGTDKSTQRHDPNAIPYSEANLVPAKFNGIQNWMAVEDGRVADLFNVGSLGLKDNPSQIIDSMNWLMSHLRRINTALNPDFIVTNFVRDQLEAKLKTMGLSTPGLYSSIKSDTKGAIASMRRMERAIQENRKFEPTSDMDRWAVRMAEDGGRTTQWGTHQKSVDKLFKEVFESQDRNGVTKAFKAGLDQLEAMNTGIENGVRLAAYKAMIEKGASKEQATSLSRTITVDFAQRGNWSNAMNSLYLFFNASTMGTVGLMSAAIRSPKMQKILMAAPALGFANAMIASMSMGEDESETSNYMKIPEYIRKTHMIIPSWDDAHPIHIPLPHGYQALHAFGGQLAEAFMQKKPLSGADYGKHAVGAVATLLSPLFPIGNLAEPVNSITPTLLRPFTERLANRDTLGRPINPEGAKGHGTPVAPSQNYFNSASAASIAISDWLHRNTGGGLSDYIQGAVEIQPGDIDHFIRTFTGGAGSTFMRTLSLAGEATGTIERSPLRHSGVNDIPLLRRFVGDTSGAAAQPMFIEMKNVVGQINEDMAQARQGLGREPAERMRELMESNPELIRAAQAVKPIIDLHSKMIGMMIKISRSERPEEEKNSLLVPLKEQRDMLMMRALKVYNQTISPPS